MAVNSRQGLIDYCMRALGSPILQINVEDDQIEDRIDDALEYWRLYHSEGDEQIHMKQLITASILNITTPSAPNFIQNEIVTGSLSGATAIVATEGPYGDNVNNANVLLVKSVKGAFLPNEPILGSESNEMTNLDNIPCILGIYDLQYITVPDLVYGITNILSLSENVNSAINIFSAEYQMRLNDLHDLSSISMIYYNTAMSYLSLLKFELYRTPTIRFNRLQNRLYLDINWDVDVNIGSYIIVEAYRALDPLEFTKVWNELWLKQYTTALIKKQWGTNLSKFNGMLLPGGVSVDGAGMYDDAIGEINALEQDLMTKNSPLQMFFG